MHNADLTITDINKYNLLHLYTAFIWAMMSGWFFQSSWNRRREKQFPYLN